MGMVINYCVFFLHSGDCFHNGFVMTCHHDPIVKTIGTYSDLEKNEEK